MGLFPENSFLEVPPIKRVNFFRLLLVFSNVVMDRGEEKLWNKLNGPFSTFNSNHLRIVICDANYQLDFGNKHINNKHIIFNDRFPKRGH